MPTWLKYSLALALAGLVGAISELPDFALPSPQDSGWNPLIALVHAVVVGAAFSLLLVTVSMWLNRSQSNVRQNNTRKGVFVFLLFAGGDFAVELLGRPLFSELSSHAALQNVVARVVRAGRGLLFPLLLLGVFIAIVLLRQRKA